MSSAQLRIHPDVELAHDPNPSAAAPQPQSPELRSPDLPPQHLPHFALKQQVADRLAAHRARRAQTSPAAAPTPTQAPAQSSNREPSRTARVRSANIAAAVAERYAHSQTYRAFLAAEAERAVHQADAAAEVATINAQAIAVAQQQLLADLDHWELPANPPQGPVAVPLSPLDYAALFATEPPPVTPRPTTFTPRFVSEPQPVSDLQPASDLPDPLAPAEPLSFTVRPFEDATHTAAAPSIPSHLRARHQTHTGFSFDHDDQLADERLALDDEIAFRHDPVFAETSAPETIAANLIEFPRQLIASRKARPRLAEGPLRDEQTPASANSQLRIFEVETDLLSSTPAADSLPTEWSSILLSALPVAEFTASPDLDYLTSSVPHAAPISLRLMSAIVDACIILTVQLLFTAVFALALTHLSGQHSVLEIPRSMAVAGTVGTLAILALLYQLLFFTLSDATPGMRYARIGLCTLADENPTRSAMRRRILATLIAACPLGFGLLWAFLDEDTLGWHDRISRMYQRAY